MTYKALAAEAVLGESFLEQAPSKCLTNRKILLKLFHQVPAQSFVFYLLVKSCKEER